MVTNAYVHGFKGHHSEYLHVCGGTRQSECPLWEIIAVIV